MIPLDIENVVILETEYGAEGEIIIIIIASRQEGTQCRVCGREITEFKGHDDWICVRHLPILGRPVYLHLHPKRYQCTCSHKPSTTQSLGWREPKSPHTSAYDEHLLLQLVNSTIEDVSQKEQVGYDAVKGTLQRRIKTEVDWAEY